VAPSVKNPWRLRHGASAVGLQEAEEATGGHTGSRPGDGISIEKLWKIMGFIS